jgi:hypothetical protein
METSEMFGTNGKTTPCRVRVSFSPVESIVKDLKYVGSHSIQKPLELSYA